MKYRYYNRNPTGCVLLFFVIFVPVAALLLIVAAFNIIPIAIDAVTYNFKDIYDAFAVVAIVSILLYLITEIEKDHSRKHPRNRFSQR